MGVVAASLIYQDHNVIDFENNDLAVYINPRNVDDDPETQKFTCHFEIAEMINSPPKRVVVYLFKGRKHIEHL